ncbi:hypothetical protein [Saccharothrix sp.]|uniref:hypothetical protein n=1 Tax=Saccharothrix sp. TaxID=1873460 RepID=UPI002810B75D|nr:hypothetical protein [Saccharothrix sp.]
MNEHPAPEPAAPEHRAPQPTVDLAAEDGFNEGLRRGQDRTNSGVDGPAVTTANSFWVAGGQQVCPVCRHTFRINDRVHVQHATADGAARVVHAGEELPCHGDAAVGQQDDPAMTAEFYAAIDKLDALNQVAKRLKPTSWMVADLPKRVRCAGCGHSLRPFEAVVLCPCDETAPKCKLPVHHDPARGLDCRDRWLLNKKLVHCPMSYRKR